MQAQTKRMFSEEGKDLGKPGHSLGKLLLWLLTTCTHPHKSPIPQSHNLFQLFVMRCCWRNCLMSLVVVRRVLTSEQHPLKPGSTLASRYWVTHVTLSLNMYTAVMHGLSYSSQMRYSLIWVCIREWWDYSEMSSMVVCEEEHIYYVPHIC